jgi:hypothetical protein
MLMVSVISHNVRGGKIVDIDDPFGGVWHVLAGSAPHGWLSSETVEPTG